MINFNLTEKERNKLHKLVIKRLENYYSKTSDYAVTPDLEIGKIRKLIASHPFENNKPYSDILNYVIDSLEQYTVHTPHPKYLGLFNPRSNFSGILADLITAVFNPQLAAWSHAPFAVEVERYLVQEFGKKFGYDSQNIDGVFATGGAEANLTAVLCALNNKYPQFAKDGVFSLKKRPVIYCSDEAHHSIAKAAKVAGLGYQVVSNIPVDEKQGMLTNALVNQIQKDIAIGKQPLMIVATAGSTGAGGIDDLSAISKIAAQYQLWFHVDGAYGAASILNSNLKRFLSGIEKSDSITFDAHKWLSLPMGISIFLTSNKEVLGKTFRITTAYMPKEAEKLPIIDPYTHSIQWSRRFMGLKLYLSLLFYGWEGYEQIIEHQRQMGLYLKEQLIATNWTIKNDTPLPIICFTDNNLQSNSDFIPFVAKEIIESRQSWLSPYPIGGLNTLRACITNYSTSKKHIEEIVLQVNQAREKFLGMR